MKKYIAILMVLLGLFVITGTSWAVSMTDVTQVDQLIASAYVNSGDANELAWVNSVLGTSYTTMTKYDADDGMAWTAVSGVSNIYAIDFRTSSPEYFFIKVGAKNGETDHYLYKNLESLNWGVISLLATGVTIENVGKLSHIGELGNVSVPEPSILILLGTGLLGLVGIGRRK